MNIAFSPNQQKLVDKTTSMGQVVVSQTESLGKMLTLDQHILLAEADGFFYHEMITHAAIFTHGHPASVAIIGPYYGILDEVLKHERIQSITCITPHEDLTPIVSAHFKQDATLKKDDRLQYETANPNEWLKKCSAKLFDIVIYNQPAENWLLENHLEFARILRPEGILITPCQASLLNISALKAITQQLVVGGLATWQTLHFPQPSQPLGWRTAIMATKRSTFHRIREKDIFNRKFSTRFYNYDSHKAALALPEFARHELTHVY